MIKLSQHDDNVITINNLLDHFSVMTVRHKIHLRYSFIS